MTKHFTESNFEKEVLQAEQPVLVDFFADWCGPCQMMAPLVDQLAEELNGKVIVGKLDVGTAPDIVAKYHVAGVPMFCLFKDGEVAGKLLGAQPKEELIKLING